MDLLRDLFARAERMLFGYMVRTGLVLRCNDAPDTSGINRAAESSAKLGEDALNFYKQVYADQAPFRQKAFDLATFVSGTQAANMARQGDFAERNLDLYEDWLGKQGEYMDRQAGIMDRQLDFTDRQLDIAEGYDKYRRDVYEPLERDIVREAQEFDTEGKREELAGMALGDVNQSFQNVKEQAARQLYRTGVNPNDGAYTGTLKQLALSQALAGADAKNKARQQAMTLASAKKADAAALGRNLPSNQATSAGLALSGTNSAAGTGAGLMGTAGAGAAGAAGNYMAGTQGANVSGNYALSSAMTPMNVAGQGAQLMGQGYGYGMQGYGQSGNLYGQMANLQNQSNSGDWLSGIGNLGRGLGAMGMTFSDKRSKKDRKPVDGELALSAVRKMPVDSWRYKEGSPADDGGQMHVGPMAQDAHAAMGEGAAPGGKMIDLTSLVGTTLAAVQELDKKVIALSAARRPA